MLTRTKQSGAFVTNELFIVLGCLSVAIIGAFILARLLRLGWLPSVAVAVGAVVIIVLALSFIFTLGKRRK